MRVFDYPLGKYYGNDQPINLKRLVRFMRDHATRLKVLHLCTLSAARRSVERDIADLQNEVDFEIKLELRESEDGDLEEEIGTGLVDGEVADLIEDEQC